MKIIITEDFDKVKIIKNQKFKHFHKSVDFEYDGASLTLGKVTPKNQWSIIEILTPEAKRRKGYASKLIEAAIDYVGGDMIFAQVSNEPSLMLHYNLGFRAYNSDLNEMSLEQTKAKRQEYSSVKMVHGYKN